MHFRSNWSKNLAHDLSAYIELRFGNESKKYLHMREKKEGGSITEAALREILRSTEVKDCDWQGESDVGPSARITEKRFHYK